MVFIHIILLNLLTLVIITQFESLHKNPFNPEMIFMNNVNDFKKAWSKFSETSDNIDKISRTKLMEFFRFLGTPLGINRNDNFFEAAGKIMKMEIRSDIEGYVNFHSLLHATMKNFFNEKLGLENANENAVKKLEIYERNFHATVLRKKDRRKSMFMGLKAKFLPKVKESKSIKINPFYDYLNLLMCFLSWRRYSVVFIEKKHQKKALNKSRKSFINKNSILIVFYMNFRIFS